MRWFTNKKKRLEMIQGIKPTSKATLKLQCLFCCKGDIEEAERLYSFFANDMPNLPDYEPVAPTWIDQAKSFMGWAKDNQNEIAQVYEFIRHAIQSKSLPSVGGVEGAAEALPPINE